MTLKKTKVAFQGEVGAYSEEASFKFFGNDIKTIPCKTFRDVFGVVGKGKADYGIVPIENSLEGTVGQNYDLLLKSKLKIFGEEILRIHHCLIAKKEAKISAIRKVYSHPQALGQCQGFLEKLKLETIPTYDTAGSVLIIKEMGCQDCAAIASERAAKIYQMKILQKGIETNSHNFTRFFIISKKLKNQSVSWRTKKVKTSIVFSTKHFPGALFSVLEVFARRKINLTKIESRPIIGKPWEYYFYLDFEGHSADVKIQLALKELKKKTLFIKNLGSYPKAKKYKMTFSA